MCNLVSNPQIVERSSTTFSPPVACCIWFKLAKMTEEVHTRVCTLLTFKERKNSRHTEKLTYSDKPSSPQALQAQSTLVHTPLLIIHRYQDLNLESLTFYFRDYITKYVRRRRRAPCALQSCVNCVHCLLPFLPELTCGWLKVSLRHKQTRQTNRQTDNHGTHHASPALRGKKW